MEAREEGTVAIFGQVSHIKVPHGTDRTASSADVHVIELLQESTSQSVAKFILPDSHTASW